MNNCQADIRLTIKMADCEWVGGQCCYDMLWLQQQGFMQLKRWGIFLLWRKDLGHPFVSTLLQCFEELRLGREVTRIFGGEGGGRDEGGVSRVKSHLEARDGAEFHEEHLEFQLHHVGQTHSGTQQWGGWELVWMCWTGFFGQYQGHNKRFLKEKSCAFF